MKKSYFFKFFVFALVGALAILPSCKDYDDDISNLESQLSSLKGTVDQIDAAVKAGSVISNVASTADGIKITLSNGQSYDITNGANGANGTNGVNGADGSVVTIGENGNWFIDGVDTELAARGPQGETGAPGTAGKDGVDGKDGAPGADGKDGVYYYPKEDGFWYVVEGEVETKTEKTWLPVGTITAVYADGAVTLYNVEGAEEPITLGNVVLSKLTLIPDYVADEGGSLPVINFSPLVAECGEIAPSTLVRYQVSPSNAVASQIDTENITFKYNSPTVLYVGSRSSAIDAKAKFVSLTNGVLTVEVNIDTEKLEGVNSRKIDQIMLMVPLKTGGEVSSDWAQVASSETYSEELALVRTPKIDEEMAWSEMELTTDLDATKDLTDSPVIVDIEYDETLDLLEVVNTMFKETWSAFNIDTYNLEYNFHLDYYNEDTEEYETIVYEVGANKTDQQKFINLVGSEVSTRVYDLDGPNPASVDRTPIVRVTLDSKDGSIDCPVLEGFIKLSIVEKKVVPVPPVTIPATGNVEAGCDDYTLRIGTQRMNEEFYAKAEVSKTFFHTNYTWAQLAGGVGTITQINDPNDTESFNLVWTVTADSLEANIGKTITKSGTYTYGGNVIQVTFTANVTQPSVNLSGLLLDNYWFSNNTYIKHNVATPDLDATDPLLATYENNISAAFKTTADKLLDLEFANEDYVGYSYEYVFDITANQPIKAVDGITITVAEDGKTLLAAEGTGTPEVVATILAQAEGTGDILEYNEDSELGKYLLNKGPEFMKARVKLLVWNDCEQPVVVKAFGGKDSFLVHFLRPVNVEGQAADNFTDGVDFGAEGSVLDLRDVVQLSDWRNYVGNVTTYYFDPNHENYYDYYDVQSYTVDLTEITPVGLTVGGVALTELPSTIVIDQVAPSTDYPYGTLTYRNNGANLATQFTLKVPVTVTYKWGEVVTVVDVLVKPTTEVRSAR